MLENEMMTLCPECGEPATDERGLCDACIDMAELICESGDNCDNCPNQAECEADE